jgi:hypothetical protein
MKKIFFVFLLVIVAVFAYAASDEVELYKNLYNFYTNSHETQLGFLQGVAAQNIEDAGELYALALNRLNREQPGSRTAAEQKFAEELAILLSNLLGQERYTAAAADLWRTVETFSEPLVKAEAMIALGKVRATTYLPQILRILNALNEAPPRDRFGGERIAYGAIVSLEKYQDMAGYLPVYFASIGWYTDYTKSQARESLKIISADPTGPMSDVINGIRYDNRTKLAALQAIGASDVSKEEKSAVALTAFQAGWRTGSVDTGQYLKTMRKTAMQMLRANGCSDNAIYPLLDKSYQQYGSSTRSDADQDEATLAILTLRELATPEAVHLLSGYLDAIIMRGSQSQKELILARELMPALGAIGHPDAKKVLNAVIVLNWTPADIERAKDALSKIR